MPFLAAKNPHGDYYRAFLKGWEFSAGERRSIPLFGIGQSAFDWDRSLRVTGAPTLKGALGMVDGYSWGFDQTLATSALMNGQICHFPSNYVTQYRVVSQESSTASVERDAYTCLKPKGGIFDHQCLCSGREDVGCNILQLRALAEMDCHFSHFTPDATEGMFKQVYNTIASQSGLQDVKMADRILAEEFEELLSLRKNIRPGIHHARNETCMMSLERRKCNSERRPSLPFVSGDLFRCLADVIFDETNNYQADEGDIGCLHFLKSQPDFREPYLVFVKTDLLHNHADSLKEMIDDVMPGKYILMTHNSDFGASDDVLDKVEGLSQLVWWYGQNIAMDDIRTTIPIGLENRHHQRQLPEYYSLMVAKEKSVLATASFRPRILERQRLLRKLEAESWVDTPGFGYGSVRPTPNGSKHEAWLRDQTKYRFVFSPPGNGIDCHRTWEMVLVGVIPILRRTEINSVFTSLEAEGAVLIVDDWNEVNRTLLEDHWRKWGDGLVQRHRLWHEDEDTNVMIARHWVKVFSRKMAELSKVKQRTSIATLTGNRAYDIDNLVRVLTSLDLNMPHDKKKSTLLVFNEGNLDLDQKRRIQDTTKRNVSFPEVEFDVFPNGFDPITEQSTWPRPGMSKFGYQQMCRFWTYRIWLHPVLDDYDTFMRFDTDSCFTAKLPEHYPGLPLRDGGYVYGANLMKSDQRGVTAGLFATAQKYIMENNITVKNPALHQKMSSPMPAIVYNNFEISNVTFFRQPHVLNFTKRMAEEEPFGILRTRWGDAPLRTMTLSIFADESEVAWDAQPDGYKHRSECVLGKTYHLNQAASGMQEELCEGNCVEPYEMKVYGRRSSSKLIVNGGRSSSDAFCNLATLNDINTECQDDNEGLRTAGFNVECSAFRNNLGSSSLEGHCNMPIESNHVYGSQKLLKHCCRKTCEFCGSSLQHNSDISKDCAWYATSNRCANDDNYNKSWLHPDLKYAKFYPSAMACCLIAFGNVTNCEVRDGGCTANALLLEPGQAPTLSQPNPLPLLRNDEAVKDPLLFDRSDGWNGTSFEDAISFCKNRAGSRSICPWKSYCPRGQLFEGITKKRRYDEQHESWAPVGYQGQPVWVAVGTVYPCMQSGMDKSDKVESIMCCRGGEEEPVETLTSLATVNQTELWVDGEECRDKCRYGPNSTEGPVILPPHQRYCLSRCRWVYRQKALSRLTDFSKAQSYDQRMTVSPPLIGGRCSDISDKLHYDGMCASVAHRQKPMINLVMSSNTWLGNEFDMGLRDCAASRCDVSAGPGHSNLSHVYAGTIQKRGHPGQIEKVTAGQINVMVHPESLKNTDGGKPMQPDINIDWLVSHRQDGFPTSSWVPFSYINADDNNFRITGRGHENRRAPIPVFIRNCSPNSVHSNREGAISELGKYLDIEQFGKCNLAGATKAELEDAYPECVGHARRSAMWDAQKECVFFHSMFALVAENSFEENYLTEKIYQPLKMGTVPLVIGNSSLYRHHLPNPNAAIFLDDYVDYEAAAGYIKTLMKDSSLWQKHLAWKDRAFSEQFSHSAVHSFATLPCDLCDKYAEEVFPNSRRSWDRSLGLETLDPCVVDILSRHTMPDNLPLINPAFGFDAVFVVHYTPLKERKEAMKARVREQLGVDPIFIEDFDREDLTEEDAKCFGNSEAQMAFIKRVCKLGEVSLMMKHFVIYFYMVQKSLDNVLVLEDDSAFIHGEWTTRDSIWQNIIRDLPASYDLLFLSGFGARKRGKKVSNNIYLAQESRVSSMYLISQKGARNMLRSLPMVAVIDFQMNYAANWKGNTWMAQLPGFHGPRTVNIELYHTEPFMSNQLEPDNSRKKTATWKID